MKSKKVVAKLSLHKETVVNLENGDLKAAKGGTGIHVPTFEPVCMTEFCDWITIIDCPSVNCM